MHRKLDIALYVGIVARLFANVRGNHFMAIKWIMRCLKWTKDYGLYYKKKWEVWVDSLH